MSYCSRCPGEHQEVWDCGECGLEKRLAELKVENPGAVIIPPGVHECINGKKYYNPHFIIGK